MKLHSIYRDDGGRRMYCGPAALCAISGRSYESVRAVVNEVRRRPANSGVLGMTNSEIERALILLGFNVAWREVSGKPTLARWLRERGPKISNKVLLVNVTGHYLVVKGRKMIDNHTKDPVFIRQGPHRRARVRSYWIVEKGV